MRFLVETALTLAMLLVGAGLAPGQKVLEENPFYLRADKRLQVTLNVEAEHPKLAQIVGSLREATGLDLIVDPSLKGREPDYGVILPSKRGYHAWQLMELVARRDLEHGYWEKTDQGYRLKGEWAAAVAKSRPEEKSTRLGHIWFLGIGGVLLVVLLVWAKARFAARSGLPPPNPAPADPAA